MFSHARLIDLLGEKGAMIFFMGGDNFISPSNGLDKEDFLEAFKKIEG
ncbi:GTP cyclohydrolase IIa, partial [Candidatus Altiarchaeota archaeon]